MLFWHTLLLKFSHCIQIRLGMCHSTRYLLINIQFCYLPTQTHQTRQPAAESRATVAADLLGCPRLDPRSMHHVCNSVCPEGERPWVFLITDRGGAYREPPLGRATPDRYLSTPSLSVFPILTIIIHSSAYHIQLLIEYPRIQYQVI